MIRALIVDDHPAVLGGLVSAFRSEAGFVPLATAGTVSGARRAAERRGVDVDVALVDYQLADGDGLTLCRQLKLLAPPPAVLIYSAFAPQELIMGAIVAGADGLLDKGASLDELFDAVRTVARGGKALPDIRPEAVAPQVARLDVDDLPILGLRVDGATVAEIAAVLGLEQHEVTRRLAAMLKRLTDPIAAPGAAR